MASMMATTSCLEAIVDSTVDAMMFCEFRGSESFKSYLHIYMFSRCLEYAFFINIISNNVNYVDNETLKCSKRAFEVVYDVNKRDTMLISCHCRRSNRLNLE